MTSRLLHGWIARAAFALVLIAAPAHQGALASGEVLYGQGLLWRVQRPGAVSHLFGTMHSNHPDITRLPEPVAAAFDAARSLGLEVVLDADATGQLGAATRLPNGDLETLLGRTRFERVADVGWRYGIGTVALLRLKPSAVMELFSLPPAEFARQHARGAEPPLDLLLQHRAAARGMAIFALESAPEQIAVFDDLPLADQIALLDVAIADHARITYWWTRMKEAYLTREIGAIFQLMSESVMAADRGLAQLFQERLIDRRNVRMVERMTHRLATGKVFIAVGALHLPGQRGILNLLAQQGYAITRVY